MSNGTLSNSLFQNYVVMSEAEQIRFLDLHIRDATDLTAGFLLKAIQHTSNSLALWYLIKGLGLCKAIDGVSYIIQVCKQPEKHFDTTSLHAICAWSLGQIGSAAYEPTKELLRETDPETRRCAVDALGELRDPEATELLCETLKHDEFDVQLWAGLSLSKLGERAIECLHETIRNADYHARMIALDAIIRIGSDHSLPVLKDLLINGAIDDRRLILETAGKYHKMLTDELRLISISDDVTLAQLAHQALSNISN